MKNLKVYLEFPHSQSIKNLLYTESWTHPAQVQNAIERWLVDRDVHDSSWIWQYDSENYPATLRFKSADDMLMFRLGFTYEGRCIV